MYFDPRDVTAVHVTLGRNVIFGLRQLSRFARDDDARATCKQAASMLIHDVRYEMSLDETPDRIATRWSPPAWLDLPSVIIYRWRSDFRVEIVS